MMEEKVNMRGGIDRVLTDAILKDLKGRSTQAKYAEASLRTNGSGTQMSAVDEQILSCFPGQSWYQAEIRMFTVNHLFEYAVVGISAF